jgi:hypothetical protein
MDNAAVDQTEDNALTYEASDEAVESAGYGAKGLGYSVTLAFCSGLETCPA